MSGRANSFFQPFRDWPISRKLLTILVATTTLALGVAGIGITISDSLLFQGYLERDLSALSQIIADNSTGALAFDDPKSATETLGALRARTHLIAACIYRTDGSLLARYSRPQSNDACPPPAATKQIRFQSDGVFISHPVLLAGRNIGTLTLLYDLGEIAERRTLYGGTVLGLLIVSSILAALVSSRLRRFITTPISRLADSASAVSASRDYSIRAEKLTGDELGVLVDTFNEMLARIQSRDNELKQALAAGEEANRRLARSNDDLERFAFIASHDLQEPLRMITVYTQLLQKRSLLDPSPQTAEFVAHIVGGTRRMRELLGDLLAYAELGAPSDPSGAVDLNTVFNKSQENLAFVINKSDAVVKSMAMPTVRAYEGHFIALFQNLIGNAIKYRSDKRPDVQVGYQHEGGELRFSVSDNGLGIAPEYHSKIFVPFKRLHGSEIPGSGIGLAICKRVVERYGGRIWVESTEGRGSSFHFALPDTLLVEESGKERAAP